METVFDVSVDELKREMKQRGTGGKVEFPILIKRVGTSRDQGCINSNSVR